MPRKKPSELIAGLFVLLGLVVLLGVVLWLGAADLLKPHGQTVTFYVPMSEGSVGIIEGAEVTLGDGRIGRIIEILPDPNQDPNQGRCLYRARLERTDIVVRSDASAVVEAPLVGQPKVALVSIGRKGPLADDAHPVRIQGAGLGAAMRKLGEVAETLGATAKKLQSELDAAAAESLLAKIHRIVADLRLAGKSVATIAANVQAETKAGDPNSLLGKIRRSAADVNAATSSLAHQMDPNAKDVLVAKLSGAAGNLRKETDANAAGSLMAKAHGTVDEVQGMVKDGRPKVDRALTAVASAAERIDAYTKKDVGEILAQLREANTKILKVVGDFAVVSQQAKEVVTLNRDNIDETIDNLAQVSVDLKSAAKEVRRNPWRLFYEPDKKELRSQNLYDAVRAFSNGASQLDQSIAKLRTLQKIKSDDPTFTATAAKIHKYLAETFAKFSKAEQALWKELEK